MKKFLGFSLTPPTLLVTFHPVTLQSKETSNQIKNLLTALDKIDSMIIFTYPNADAGGRIIINAIEGFLKSHTNAKAFKSLGSHLYLNLLSQADAIVGNSSSGIVEAASFKIPSVNIGMRQKGRLFPKNVISTSDTATSIMRGIRKALSQDFRKQIEHLKNPYDQGGTAKNIVKVLSCFEIRQKLLLKKFTDH